MLLKRLRTKDIAALFLFIAVFVLISLLVNYYNSELKVSGFLILYAKKEPSSLKKVIINDSEILVEIAQTPKERAKGLSGRQNLPQNRGMLFIFERPDRYSFWMKETLIPLDFLWIAHNKIVEATQNVQPQNFQPSKTLTPAQAADKVLELNAGTIERLNIKVGDMIKF